MPMHPTNASLEKHLVYGCRGGGAYLFGVGLSNGPPGFVVHPVQVKFKYYARNLPW